VGRNEEGVGGEGGADNRERVYLIRYRMEINCPPE